MSSKQVNKSDGQLEVVMSDNDLDGVPMEVESGGEGLGLESEVESVEKVAGNRLADLQEQGKQRIDERELCDMLEGWTEDYLQVREQFGREDPRTINARNRLGRFTDVAELMFQIANQVPGAVDEGEQPQSSTRKGKRRARARKSGEGGMTNDEEITAAETEAEWKKAARPQSRSRKATRGGVSTTEERGNGQASMEEVKAITEDRKKERHNIIRGRGSKPC